VTYEDLEGNPPRGWTPWYTWEEQDDKQLQDIVALTTAWNGQGEQSLWALTVDGVLWCKNQSGIRWLPWVKGWSPDPRSGAPTPKFSQIYACGQGGSRGRAIWVTRKNGELYWSYEPYTQGGGWVTGEGGKGWPRFDVAGKPPQSISSLCAGKSRGRVTLWALARDNLVHSASQTTADNHWENWDAGATRLPSAPSLLNQIVDVLCTGTDAKYIGVTYELTSHNTFTLIDTPRLWESKSSTAPNPIPACEDLLDKIADTIAQAREIVDITMMNDLSGVLRGPIHRREGELPIGGFQKALNRGFRSLVKSKSSPLVRITIGITTPSIITEVVLKNWVKATIERDGGPSMDDVTFSILIGGGKETPTSWNHSKIVAADGVRAVVGGHNLWSSQYLGATPVHDVSGLFEGSVVRAVHRFCDQLWINHGTNNPFLIPGAWMRKPKQDWQRFQGKISRSEIASPESKERDTRMLALGRLGDGIVKEFTVATNASVSARIMALCRARKNIRISQQTLYCSIVGLPGFDFYTLLAIIKAVQVGVKVEIVITNDVPKYKDGGYGSFEQQVADSLAALQIADRLGLSYEGKVSLKSREDLAAWAVASLKPPASKLPLGVFPLPTEARSAEPLAQLNRNLKLARLYYAPGLNQWKVASGMKNAANHAKVYIIDDTHFYVGSDNMYLSGSAKGHQEYGYLIEGQTETKDFLENYWKKLWKNSGSHRVPIQYPKNRRRDLWTGPVLER
jgi:phosphatidylserine/phosphatidylglycerophosphate/cardiolipin synthase-like enzyme